MTTKKRSASPNRLIFKIRLLTIFSGWLISLTAFGQTPPPNDNYSNRIVLTGTDITFSGTLAGATYEVDRELTSFSASLPSYGTVWWTWTAPTDTVLTLQILNPSTDPKFQGLLDNALIVYSATNGSPTPDDLILPALGVMNDYPQLGPLTLSMPVSSGSNYQIQLIGYSRASANYNIHLVATNTPIIITQPRSQTVYSNDSALFYVVSAGFAQANFTFQWFFNGTNLPGETAPMLALTNIDGSMAGAYTVAVSNSAGFTLSAPAALTVSQSNFPVSLSAIGIVSNAFMFSMAGEVGRSYRLQSSVDFVNWASETDFPMSPYNAPNATSVFFDTNSPQFFALTNLYAKKFFRVAPYVATSSDVEICINNLRQIRIAKLLWQREANAGPTAWPASSDLRPYFPHQALPFCPNDSTQQFLDSYRIANLQTDPSCLIHSTNHVLEDPR